MRRSSPLPPYSMDGPNWETLCRNGQLVWDKVPEHREILERFYAFWKGTENESVIAAQYPAFYAEVNETKTATFSVKIKQEKPKKKAKTDKAPKAKAKSSPKPHARKR